MFKLTVSVILCYSVILCHCATLTIFKRSAKPHAHFRCARDIHGHYWTLSVWGAVFLREKDPGLWRHWVNLIQRLKHSYSSLRKSPRHWPHLYLSSDQNFFFCSRFWIFLYFYRSVTFLKWRQDICLFCQGRKCFRLTTFVFVWLQPSCTCFVKYSFFRDVFSAPTHGGRPFDIFESGNQTNSLSSFILVAESHYFLPLGFEK